MIARFYMCFGAWGVLSALAWLAALAACAASVRRPRRGRRFTWALGLAAAGFVFAKAQAAWEQAIVLDRSEELRAAREAQQQLQMREEQARREQGESFVRFAEDAPGEAVGSAIMTADELTGRTAASNAAPAYRSGGRQQRAAGKVDAQAARLARDAARGSGDSPSEARTLKLAEYRLAGRLARDNRRLADFVLLVVLGVAAGDYLRRFHHPVDGYLPLPLAGTWLTHFSHGPSLVHWPGATDARMRAFLEDAARRGESFLYIGDRFAPGGLAVHRFRLGRLRFWPLPVLTWGRDGAPPDAEFALDAVWFGRYAMVVPAAAADELLSALLELLAGRAAAHATALRVPHLVWDTGRLPEASRLERLARACARTGVRLVLVSGRLPEDLAGRFMVMDRMEERKQ